MRYNVTLNIYDLPQQLSVNNNLHSMGLGFYHSGVQFHNHEYSFSEQGVSRTRPLLPQFGTIREQIHITFFEGSLDTFLAIVDELQRTSFPPGTYHVIQRNCNHFADALIYELCGARIPAWVNRAASVGSSLAPSRTGSGTRNSSSETSRVASSSGSSVVSRSGGTDNGASCQTETSDVLSYSFPALGKTKAPSLPSSTITVEEKKTQETKNEQSTASSIFSWLFGSSSSSSTTTVSSASSGSGNNVNPSIAKKEGSKEVVGDKRANPKQKKELTEKQKAMIEKLKTKN